MGVRCWAAITVGLMLAAGPAARAGAAEADPWTPTVRDEGGTRAVQPPAANAAPQAPGEIGALRGSLADESPGNSIGIVETGTMGTGPIGTLPDETGTIETGTIETGTIETGPIETGPIETGTVSSARSGYAIADAAALDGDGARTVFRVGLSKGVTAEVFTLANPYRVVVDLPDVAFSLGQGVGREGRGLVRAFRYGLFAEGKARIVLDVTGPVRIEKAAMTAGADGRRVELAIEIAPMASDKFGGGTGAVRQASAHAKPAADEGAAAPRQKVARAKPVVLIDPGHGGVDPGAVGASNILEKSVALSVGLELRRALMAGGRYEVRLTRATDVFVSLDKRLKICREVGADLFISVHADSLGDASAAQAIRGATVYTLSERASDEQARLMAEKENASDLIAGIDAGASDGKDQVKSILIDLMKRETSNFSHEFSKILVPRLGKAGPLAPDPQRSAAFKVLKQTHAPAVLIELGYMSNAGDMKRLASAEWQRKVASEVRAAVDTFFARQTARAK